MNLFSCILVLMLGVAFVECSPWSGYDLPSIPWESFRQFLREHLCFRYDFDVFGCLTRETFHQIQDLVKNNHSVLVSYKKINSNLHQTGFFYRSSRFINNYENRLRLGLNNETRMFNLDHSWSLNVRKLKIVETFDLVCTRGSQTCCRRTRANQKSCSAIHPSICRPLIESPTQEKPNAERKILFACPLCHTYSSNSDIYYPPVLRSSVAFNWTSCALEEPRVSCSLYIIKLTDFVANEFNEVSFTVREKGLIGVQFDAKFVTQKQLQNCTALSQVNYEMDVDSERQNEKLY